MSKYWKDVGGLVHLCEEIGIPKWMKDTDGVVYICGGFTLYKTSKGYRHQDGRFATSTEIHRFGLE